MAQPTQDLSTPEKALPVVTILWAGLTFMPLLATVAFYVVRSGGSMGAAPFPVEVAYAALGFSLLATAAMVALPSRLVPAKPGVSPGSLLVTRTIMGCAFGEGGALLCGVMYLLTGVEAVLAGVAVFVAVSLARRPTRESFEAIEREQRQAVR